MVMAPSMLLQAFRLFSPHDTDLYRVAVDNLAFLPLATRLTSLKLETGAQLRGTGRAIGGHLPNLKELVLAVGCMRCLSIRLSIRQHHLT